jgi:hypothetical protein
MHGGLIIAAGIFGTCSAMIVTSIFEVVRFIISELKKEAQGPHRKKSKREPSPTRKYLEFLVHQFPSKFWYAGLSGFFGGIVGLYFGWNV